MCHMLACVFARECECATCLYVCAFVYVCVHVCVLVSVCACVCACALCMCLCMCVCTCAFVCAGHSGAAYWGFCVSAEYATKANGLVVYSAVRSAHKQCLSALRSA
jgi:hypothetical protein